MAAVCAVTTMPLWKTVILRGIALTMRAVVSMLTVPQSAIVVLPTTLPTWEVVYISTWQISSLVGLATTSPLTAVEFT